MWLILVSTGHLGPNARDMAKLIWVEKLSLEIRRKKVLIEARKISPYRNVKIVETLV